jgi:hypothetical protein
VDDSDDDAGDFDDDDNAGGSGGSMDEDSDSDAYAETESRRKTKRKKGKSKSSRTASKAKRRKRQEDEDEEESEVEIEGYEVRFSSRNAGRTNYNEAAWSQKEIDEEIGWDSEEEVRKAKAKKNFVYSIPEDAGGLYIVFFSFFLLPRFNFYLFVFRRWRGD